MTDASTALNPCNNKEEIALSAAKAVEELIEAAKLQSGSVLLIGCSTSEIIGNNIGHGSSLEAAQAVFDAVAPLLNERGIHLAAQCCEHLNRCVIIEAQLAEQLNLDIVNVVPQPKAGGSFASTAYANFARPVAVEALKADAGLDIGQTLIGMHIKQVAVPVRLSVKTIGSAVVTAARSRPKFIGGVRAVYDDELL